MFKKKEKKNPLPQRPINSTDNPVIYQPRNSSVQGLAYFMDIIILFSFFNILKK